MKIERSVSIGRDAVGSSIVTGDQNVALTEYHSSVPPPERVDIKAEVAALRKLLTSLASPDHGKLERALADAEEEAAKPEPDKDEIGSALDRALAYAKKANGFAEQAAKLKPHLQAACGWLGQHWRKLLAVLGVGN